MKTNIEPLRSSYITLQHNQNSRQIGGGIPWGSFFRIGNMVYQKPAVTKDRPGEYWCLTTGQFEKLDGLTHGFPVDINVTEFEYDVPIVD